MTEAETFVLVLADDPADADVARAALRAVLVGPVSISRVERRADLDAAQVEHRADLVVASLGILDVAALSTVQALVARWPAVPLLVMVDAVDETRRIEALRRGAFDVVAKARMPASVVRDALARAEHHRRQLDSVQHRRAELERRLLHADRLASVGQLAAGVAHEVNNPATFISANGKLVMDELALLRDELEHALDHEPKRLSGLKKRLDLLEELSSDSQVGIRRISRVVRDLGAFARIDDDTVARLNINRLLEFATKLVGHELRHRGRLELELEPLPDLAGDSGRLIHAFVNLLVNAIHALDGASARPGRITIRSYVRDASIFVEVEDTGVGIGKADIDRVFEPFFTTKERGQGTGLGLSLVAETMRKHGGEVRVRSQEGLGTTFTVELPVRTGLVATAPPPAANDDSGVIRTRKRRRLLVIDDERLVRRALRRLLAEHDVDLAAGGAEALQCLAESEAGYDAIICDLMMPEMTGEVFFNILERDHPAMAPRVLFVTGGAMTAETRAFIERSGDRVVSKPVEREELLKRIDAVCRRAVPLAFRPPESSSRGA